MAIRMWVWLECIGVVSGCCCKEVLIIDILIIIITFPYSTCISSIFGSTIPTSLFIFKCFFVLSNYWVRNYLENILLVFTIKPRGYYYQG